MASEVKAVEISVKGAGLDAVAEEMKVGVAEVHIDVMAASEKLTTGLASPQNKLQPSFLQNQ